MDFEADLVKNFGVDLSVEVLNGGCLGRQCFVFRSGILENYRNHEMHIWNNPLLQTLYEFLYIEEPKI